MNLLTTPHSSRNFCLFLLLVFLCAQFADGQGSPETRTQTTQRTSTELPARNESGRPFIRNYEAREYQAHSQNWSILQDQRGVMYFGNSIGVLEYDG